MHKEETPSCPHDLRIQRQLINPAFGCIFFQNLLSLCDDVEVGTVVYIVLL